ncbi:MULTISPECIES: DUF883 family protein [Prochlorococcus]|uniref:DUF883 domain-containing protein n=1 Tax=Prochlorococcus marinus (strain SARG / CCMP1375 / SS120) TaxID=167539 RepID=Q7VEE6_PROMA|nr:MULTISPECIES: DUF883 family protein [Prochlorococcus]AAP99113.1 Predicted protein [Prochlorococcus marinus subsp. marinus str. CCMP1375]KGG11627.1 hypothetical protein EV04_0914 [Prochlorococcus marinus str. LG]KGG22365.1 hypothetical protein EV08_0183 [Prochlorococcus marinus str. SS2]KGG22701.1 hypothetical protein EV09_1440 [Prochlorococcus marinus str. SS35]KGG32878.1 hypothetical protein EV10_0858 [Prochlorococcus marinus str. SS51]
MESENSATCDTQASVEIPSSEDQSISNQWFSDQFDDLLPKIQEQWPDLAKQTIEATRGSLDDLVKVLASHSGKTSIGVIEQLEDLLNSASDRTKDLAESLEPLEKQLEDLLDELNCTLRPKIETPVRQRPLLAIGIATGLGVLLGILMSGGRRS